MTIDPNFTPPPAGVPTMGATNFGATTSFAPTGPTSMYGNGMVVYLGTSKYTPLQLDSPRPDRAELPRMEKREGNFLDLYSKFEQLPKKKLKDWALLLTISGFIQGAPWDERLMGPQDSAMGYAPGSSPVGDVPLDKAIEYAKNMPLGQILEGYSNLLKEAADKYSRGDLVTPTDVLKRAIEMRLPMNVEWDGKLSSLTEGNLTNMLVDSGIMEQPQDLSGTFTQTSRSLDFMDPMDAKALARGVLQRELGRDPTRAEYEDFISAIHAAEAHNPNVTRTTYTKDENGDVVSSNSTTQQGLSSAGLDQLATERARRNPDWAEWQAMGTYAPALFAALGAAVPGT